MVAVSLKKKKIQKVFLTKTGWYEQVEAEEQKLDVEGLIARAIANTEKTQIRYYEDEHRG